MVSDRAIATLVIFILSIIFVIYPVSIPIRLPHLGKRRIHINLTTAPILAIAILWASQCLGPQQIRNGIVGTDGVKPYNILILFFSLAYMAITLDITGVLQAAAYWVSNKGGSSGRRLYFYFYVMLTLLSVFLGNDPVILSGTAFLVYYTDISKLNNIAWIMAEFAAANTASMVLFVGNPTNVVICEGFLINNAAFTAYTILPFLGCIVACYVALIVQFHRHVQPTLTPTVLDPKSVLLDPKGAWIGSAILGTCLVVIIIVSFFHVDVWKISLPFAGAKFIFDLFWDAYRPDVHRTREAHQLISLHQLEKKLSEGELDIATGKEYTTESDIVSQQAEYPPDTRSRADRQLASEKTVTPSHHQQKTTDSSGTLRGGSADLRPSTIKLLEKPESFYACQRWRLLRQHTELKYRFPTFFIALPRLPFGLVPFAFCQFILIEALTHQGWITIFSRWLIAASGRQFHATIWLVGVLGVLLCNLAGTNIGATILLTKVVRGAQFDPHTDRAAAVALAVASNIGAVSFTFSASLAGLLWKEILRQKGVKIGQRAFAMWNALPLAVMTAVGVGIVSAEMEVLKRASS